MSEGEADGVRSAVADADTDGAVLALALPLTLPLCVAAPLRLRLMEALAIPLALPLADALAEAEDVEEPVRADVFETGGVLVPVALAARECERELLGRADGVPLLDCPREPDRVLDNEPLAETEDDADALALLEDEGDAVGVADRVELLLVPLNVRDRVGELDVVLETDRDMLGAGVASSAPGMTSGSAMGFSRVFITHTSSRAAVVSFAAVAFP